jgi:C4-type Zn-finger protein
MSQLGGGKSRELDMCPMCGRNNWDLHEHIASPYSACRWTQESCIHCGYRLPPRCHQVSLREDLERGRVDAPQKEGRE